ncbi:hypothetical protein Leryth_026198 [Lithospermum erythrorhizon]|nr:hypothetical protein Leryth_026198 [Lithospermum erythrorhizon]
MFQKRKIQRDPLTEMSRLHMLKARRGCRSSRLGKTVKRANWRTRAQKKLSEVDAWENSSICLLKQTEEIGGRIGEEES